MQTNEPHSAAELIEILETLAREDGGDTKRSGTEEMPVLFALFANEADARCFRDVANLRIAGSAVAMRTGYAHMRPVKTEGGESLEVVVTIDARAELLEPRPVRESNEQAEFDSDVARDERGAA